MTKKEHERLLNLLEITLGATKSLHNNYLRTLMGISSSSSLAEEARQQMSQQSFTLVKSLYETTKVLTGNVKHS